MPDTTRVRRLSHWLFHATGILTYVLPLVIVGQLSWGLYDPTHLVRQFPALPADATVTPFAATLTAIVAVLALFPLIGAFGAMRCLFDRYRHGETLTEPCATAIRRIGRWLAFAAIVMALVPTLQLAILSASTGSLILSFGLTNSTLGFLLSGALLTTIGWVMGEAVAIADENRAFI